VADFNHDGYLDLVSSARSYGAYSSIGLNSGDGTAFSWVPGGYGGASPRAADLNAEGNADLVAAGSSRLDVTLVRADGMAISSLTFSTASTPGAVAVADFDGDGKVDLAASNPEVDQVSILLNAPFPTLAVSDVTLAEGNGGTRNGVFTVALTPPTAAAVTVDYATADGTATSGTDYGSVAGTLTFSPGMASQTVSAPVFGDRDFEADETFFLNLNNPTAAEIARGQGQGTIRNDDTGYALSVSDASASEGGTAAFTVSMPVASPQTVTVDYATADGTAVAGVDYTATSGVLTFAPGQTSQAVAIALLPDPLDEADETLVLRLSGAVNALITDGDGQATILDDDPEPALSVDDASVAETHSLRTLELTVALSALSGREVSVRYATADGTAKAGTDYLPASGALVFSPGITAQKAAVTILGDRTAEAAEAFRFVLAEPRNAVLGDGEAAVTIADDDTLLKAEITDPPPGSVLASSTVTFRWSPGSGALQYWLSVGTTPGGTQIYDAGQGTALLREVGGLPTDGSSVHVRLWSLLGNEWAVNDYSYVAASGTSPWGFYTVVPCRLLDTRNPTGPYGGPALAAGADRTFTLAGRCGIPATAVAVSVNMTVTQPTAAGSLTLYPADVPLPLAWSITYPAGQTRANNGVEPVSESGEIKVRCSQPSGSTHFILDVNGYFEGPRPTARDPGRAADRTGPGPRGSRGEGP
jgi:hypothetical protein